MRRYKAERREGRPGHGVTQAEARVRLLQRSFIRLREPDAAYERCVALIVACRVLGVQVHDARLVAAMLAAGVSRILTFNTADLARYPGTTAVHPSSV